MLINVKVLIISYSSQNTSVKETLIFIYKKYIFMFCNIFIKNTTFTIEAQITLTFC